MSELPRMPPRSSPDNDHADLGHIVGLLQSEYARIRAWLSGIHHQLVEQSIQVDRQLGHVTALLEQLDEKVRIIGPSTTSDCAVVLADTPVQEGLPVLRVYTLGRFRLSWGERKFSLCSNKKANEILHYLLIQPDRSASKDRLLELFWPDDLADKAAHKLHIAISALRQTLNRDLGPAQWIEFEDERYYLNPAITVWLDTDELTVRLHAGRHLEEQGQTVEAVAQYEAARALYNGDFLVEHLYADWAAAPRAHLEELYLTLLGRLAGCYLELGRYEECVACCRQIVERDSFREDAYRQLMVCYVRMGLRNQALRVYQECAQTLQRELGVVPMRETVALYEQIMQI